MALPLSYPSVASRYDESDHLRYISQYSKPFMLPEEDTNENPEHLAELYLFDAFDDFEFQGIVLDEMNTAPDIDLDKNYVQLRLTGINPLCI